MIGQATDFLGLLLGNVPGMDLCRIGLGSGHSNLLLNQQKTSFGTAIATLIGQFYPQS